MTQAKSSSPPDLAAPWREMLAGACRLDGKWGTEPRPVYSSVRSHEVPRAGDAVAAFRTQPGAFIDRWNGRHERSCCLPKPVSWLRASCVPHPATRKEKENQAESRRQSRHKRNTPLP